LFAWCLFVFLFSGCNSVGTLPFSPPIPLQIATDHLGGGCKQCGGYLTNTIRPDAARKRLAVFRNLAAYHGFELLQQMADFALGRT
jgi:hypothetical protein